MSEVLDRTHTNLASFWRDHGVRDVPIVESVGLYLYGDDGHGGPRLDRLARPDEPFWWPDSHYLWFQWRAAGGIDVHASRLSGTDYLDAWRAPGSGERYRAFLPRLEKAFEVDRYWWFRRAGGGSGFRSLAYGMLAASVAELTIGVVDSDDGAWEPSRLPIDGTDFVRAYFRPELCLDDEERAYTWECIRGLGGDVVR